MSGLPEYNEAVRRWERLPPASKTVWVEKLIADVRDAQEAGIEFPDGFAAWLLIEQNARIFFVFCAMSRNRVAVKFRHYSPRTIIETMRWHTPAQDGELAFKLSNNPVRGFGLLATLRGVVPLGFFRQRQADLVQQYLEGRTS